MNDLACTVPQMKTGAHRASASVAVVDGRYALIRELGRGGMGRVYLARDAGLDRTVALKMIDPELARHVEVTALFRREAQALARVRSEHVVQVHSFGAHEGSLFFAMEYVEGADLDVIIRSYASSGGVVPLHRAATILRQAAGGLAAVHAQGVVHRDIKPSNVVVEAGTGRPVLIDFGLAQRPAFDGTEAPVSLGTPLYMAPEQWSGGAASVSPATDVYGFGVMAFELLTGAPPFVAETAQELMQLHVAGAIPRASAARPSAAAFDAVLTRALAKSAADRYPDGRSLVRALEAALRTVLPEGPMSGTEVLPPPSMLGAHDNKGVLIVDDDESFRAFADRALQIGFRGKALHVREASSGEHALALAGAEMPDLLVLDFDMPGLNGLETLSRLRALPNGSHVRVLVASGNIEGIARCQFDVLGVVDFVEKPVALRELARVVKGMEERAGR